VVDELGLIHDRIVILNSASRFLLEDFPVVLEFKQRLRVERGESLRVKV
jgi:hypothetical protein